MATSNLQGLNLIHPESPPSNLTDAQDLLSTPLFPDFATHDLDLWSNISFASDEPFVSSRDRQPKVTDTEPRADSLTRKEAGHALTAPTSSPASTIAASQQPSFDFARFLAEFGLSANAEGGVIIPDAAGVAGLPQPSFTVPASPSKSSKAVAAPTAPVVAPPPSSRSSTAPPAKRARTSKAHTPAATPGPSSSSDDANFPDAEPDLSTPLNAAEDKRRRNTAASARFRLKKKEREAALDNRAQSLEDRVTSLERECEGLRRENGWLRGLVVGVTGGVVPAMNDAPIMTGPATAEKRKRDDEATA